MSTWTYSDWDDDSLYPTTAAKLARLRKFKTEVRGAIAANVSRDGASRDSSSLNQLYDTLVAEEATLMKRPDARTGGTIAKTRLG